MIISVSMSIFTFMSIQVTYFLKSQCTLTGQGTSYLGDFLFFLGSALVLGLPLVDALYAT